MSVEHKSKMYKIYKIFDCDDFTRLTNGIRVAQCMKLPRLPALPDQEAALQATGKLEDLVISDTLYCSSCNYTFESKQQQRLHYKLDWHRYNLRQQLAGLKPVSEDKFFDLADDISSISGSESDSDTEQDEGSPFSKEKLNKLHERRFDLDSSVSDTDGESSASKSNNSCTSNLVSRHPKVFFENADGKIFSLYRCVLHGKKDFQEKDDALVSLALKSAVNCTWAVIMLGGGHFAAGVFKGKDAVIHKTFHSYTVRARQGGSQSTRDNRSGGSHPKSAGASLRRFNEASFMQHVQDIFEGWSSHLTQCGLIFYRAVGHNRGILFGGRNAPLSRDDTRLRIIPFPTRRATFKEVKRVHDVLSTLEVYGPALDFITTFPQSPRYRRISENCLEGKLSGAVAGDSASHAQSNGVSQTTTTSSTMKPKLDLHASVDKTSDNDISNSSPKSDKRKNTKNKTIDRAKPRKSPHRPLPDIVTRLANISDSDSEDVSLVYSNVQLSLTDNLEEFHDTVPQHVKQRRKKGYKKNRDQEAAHQLSKPAAHLKKKLLTACRIGDRELLDSALDSVDQIDDNASDKHGVVLNSDDQLVTKEELLLVLNEKTKSDECNTLLHIASRGGFGGIVRKLLEFGSEPSILNKRHHPAYVLAPDKETRNVFRRFMGEFPERYDYSKSQIPSALTEDLQQRQCDKRKEIRKTKREKEKQKKQEEFEKRQKQLERDRYLALSDSEKRTIAAEQKRLLQLKKHEIIVPIIIRCFECAVDITKLVPFEYDENLFCTMNCLKLHRLKGPPTKEI